VRITTIDGVAVRDLEEKSFFYDALRKPDFQRETANWSPPKVADLVRTFVEGDLVPAVILWHAGKDLFVIDGAHRLGALIAWVQNDYGDGARSIKFFQGMIPDDQKRVAEQPRRLIESDVGTYAEHVVAIQSPEHAHPRVLELAKRLGILAVPIQWVPSRDAVKAESSFFKINQAFTAIDHTELRILRSRKSATAIAARAVVKGGTGNKYWSHFSKRTQSRIEQLAKHIYRTLYAPSIDQPIKTLDLPVAGPAYGGHALPLIFDLINLANSAKIADSTKRQATIDVLPDDKDGSETIAFLTNTKSLIDRIAGTDSSSLGLHPVLYWYSTSGAFLPAALLGACMFVRDIEEQRQFVEFTNVRRQFEGFLLNNKEFASEIVHKMGSGARSSPKIRELYDKIFGLLKSAADENAILSALRSDDTFSFLLAEDPPALGTAGGKFRRKTKSAAFLKEALEAALRCPICGGLMHRNSMTVDHIERRRDGGLNRPENAQMSHPFCNSTVKH
jgi:hypothetical protein